MITVLYFCRFILVNVCFIVIQSWVLNVSEWIKCCVIANELLRDYQWKSGALIKHVTCQKIFFEWM